MTFWHTLNPSASGAALQSRAGSPEPAFNDACSAPNPGKAYRAPVSDAGASGPASDPVVWARKLLGFAPDSVQAAILRSSASRLILCCTRQFGKSTITAIKALHHAWTRPESLVLIAAPTARQAGEWLRKTHLFLECLGIRSRTDGVNRLSLKLPNGSRLVGLPNVPGNIRGFSKASLVLIDEAAFVADELYHALNPMLAVSRGGLWLMSTPGAQSGFFYDEWSREDSGALPPCDPADPAPNISAPIAFGRPAGDRPPSVEQPPAPEPSVSRTPAGDRPAVVGRAPWPAAGPPAGPEHSQFVELLDRAPGASLVLLGPDGAPTCVAAPGSPANSGPFSWERYRITAEQCPRIPPEFLAEQRIRLGDAVFRREYQCEFVAAGTQIIDRTLLDSALDDGVVPFNGGKALWR